MSRPFAFPATRSGGPLRCARAVASALLCLALGAAAQAAAPTAPTAPEADRTAPAADTPDRATLERTPIVGNRELPKVLYIVPWKKPLPGQLSGRPVQSVLDEALAPVDREVFGRQVDYFKALAQAPKADAETSVTAGARAP